MSWEQRNSAFCEAHTDAQLVYIEAECEVVRLEAENAKLRKALRDVLSNADDTVWVGNFETLADRMRELGIEVDV